MIFIGPPSGVVFINIMIGITIAIGVCLGWAWGVITMKAALATRPTADLQRQLQKLQQASQQLAQNNLQASGQSTYQQIAIYNGVMLDTRVTVTYFCMLSLFIYIMVCKLHVFSISSFLLTKHRVSRSECAWLYPNSLLSKCSR